MAKRGQGEGSISKRDDGTWWARITIGKDENGKQKRKAFYGKTRKEVQEKLTAALNDVNNDCYIEPSKMTVAQWMDTWLREYKKNSIKPKTYAAYCSHIKCHIKPMLGKYTLKTLRNDILQRFVNELLDKELNTASVERVVNIVKSALEQAVENELIYKNPARKIKLPLKQKREAKVLSLEAQEKFIQLAKNYRNGEAFILILATGMRIGETMALTWDDIDFEKGLLSVNKTQIEYSKNNESGIKFQIDYGVPKTRTSNRKIPLIPVAIKLLIELKERQLQEKEELGRAYKDNNLIFCTFEGKAVYLWNMRQKINLIFKKLKIEDMHIHSLRHTFATRGLENGIELKVMQEILGHSSISMTADLYTHVLPDKKIDSMMKLQDTINI